MYMQTETDSQTKKTNSGCQSVEESREGHCGNGINRKENFYIWNSFKKDLLYSTGTMPITVQKTCNGI